MSSSTSLFAMLLSSCYHESPCSPTISLCKLKPPPFPEWFSPDQIETATHACSSWSLYADLCITSSSAVIYSKDIFTKLSTVPTTFDHNLYSQDTDISGDGPWEFPNDTLLSVLSPSQLSPNWTVSDSVVIQHMSSEQGVSRWWISLIVLALAMLTVIVYICYKKYSSTRVGFMPVDIGAFCHVRRRTSPEMCDQKLPSVSFTHKVNPDLKSSEQCMFISPRPPSPDSPRYTEIRGRSLRPCDNTRSALSTCNDSSPHHKSLSTDLPHCSDIMLKPQNLSSMPGVVTIEVAPVNTGRKSPQQQFNEYMQRLRRKPQQGMVSLDEE